MDAYLLLVDDSLENLNVLGSILMANKYKISLARDGASALKILEEIKVDLILLDIMMPDMDGYEVCSRIKQNPVLSDIPVIFISALNESKDIIKGFDAGGVDYITKPFKAEEVVARVGTHVKLKKQNAELKKLNADKDLFISILAHDLRSPFHNLISLTELLKSNLPKFNTIEIDSKLNVILDFSLNLYKLLEDTLLFAKSQSNRLAFNPEKLNLSKIYAEVMDKHKLSCEDKQLVVNKSLHKQDVVFADAFLLKVILDNLIANAIKFSHKGGVLNISSVETDNEILIEIADTGVGIKPLILSRLFDITTFYSTRGTANEKGTGLGLILCKELVEKHGGNINVESEPNKGSKFRFSLPLNRKDLS